MAEVRRIFTVLWEGGGNVNPFLGLQGRVEDAGVELVTAGPGWLPGAAEVGEAVARFRPDLLVVD